MAYEHAYKRSPIFNCFTPKYHARFTQQIINKFEKSPLSLPSQQIYVQVS